MARLSHRRVLGLSKLLAQRQGAEFYRYVYVSQASLDPCHLRFARSAFVFHFPKSLTLFMVKFARSQTLWLLASTLLLGSVACSSRPSSQQNSLVSAPASPAPARVSSSAPVAAPASPTPTVAQVDAYKLAEEKANSARNLSQSALTEDDWNLVSSRWQQAIAALQSIPPSSPYQAIAKTKRPEFEKELAAARQRAKQAKANTSQAPLISSQAQPLNVSSAVIRSSPGAGTVYRAPIKRRAGGTPVIDVTFNGNQTFDMIVDTGASGTVITPSMAQALGVQVVGKTKVNTASQTGVEVSLGYVHSIAVGGAVVKEVIVAIGSDALDVGLLGHDFFDDFDVTVKQDVVEFRRR